MSSWNVIVLGRPLKKFPHPYLDKLLILQIDEKKFRRQKEKQEHLLVESFGSDPKESFTGPDLVMQKTVSASADKT